MSIYLLTIFSPFIKNNLNFIGLSQKIINNFFDEVFTNISNICNAKNYSQEIFGVAMTLFHYYTYLKSFRDFDRVEIAVSCVFLACKIEYTFLKVEEATDIYHRIKKGSQFMLHTGAPPQSPDFTKFEVDILTFVGYEMDIETPHKFFVYYLEKLCPSFLRDARVINFGFLLINDTYRSNLCIYYPAKYVALASLFFTLLEEAAINSNGDKSVAICQSMGINEILLCDKTINTTNFLSCLDSLLGLYEAKFGNN